MSEESPRQRRHIQDPSTDTYQASSRRPLAVLVFLLPGIIFYEIAAVTVLGEDGHHSSLTSRSLIQTLFEIFGVIGVHLPAALLIATLVAQHMIARDPLRLRPSVLGMMAVESLLWALPLLVLAGILGYLGINDQTPAPPRTQAAAIAVGAGLYEEFVFRFVLIAAVHAVLVDLCGTKETVGRWLGVAVSVFAFASFHGIAVGGSIDPSAAFFYGVSGLFLSWLFLNRGLGVAAGAHAVYDLAVLVAIPLLNSS